MEHPTGERRLATGFHSYSAKGYPMANNKEFPMNYVTKEDLKDLSTELKEHMNLLIKPIVEKQQDIDTILFGKSRLNGLVSRTQKTWFHVKMIYGFLLGGCLLVVKSFFKL